MQLENAANFQHKKIAELKFGGKKQVFYSVKASILWNAIFSVIEMFMFLLTAIK